MAEKYRYAQIEGGPRLAFPLDTPDEVIDRVIKEQTAVPRAMEAFGVGDAPMEASPGSAPMAPLDAVVPSPVPEPRTVADALQGGPPAPQRQIHAIPGLSPAERERLLAGTAVKPQVPQGDYETVAAALGPAPAVENANVAGAPMDLLAPSPVVPEVPKEGPIKYGGRTVQEMQEGGELSRGFDRSVISILAADKGVRKYLKDSGFDVADTEFDELGGLKRYSEVMSDLGSIPMPETLYGRIAQDAPLSMLLMVPALVAGAGTSAAGMGPIGALGVAGLVGAVPEATVEAGTLYETLLSQGMDPNEARKKAHLNLVDNLALLTSTNMMEFGGGALLTKIGVKGIERFSKRFATTYARRVMTNVTAKVGGVGLGLGASSQIEGWQEWFQEGFAQAAEGEAGVFDNTDRQKEAKKMGQALGVLFGVVPAGVGVVEAGKGGMKKAYEDTKVDDIRKMLAGDKETMERYMAFADEADEMSDVEQSVMDQVALTPEGPPTVEGELGIQEDLETPELPRPEDREKVGAGIQNKELVGQRKKAAPKWLQDKPDALDAWARSLPGYGTSEEAVNSVFNDAAEDKEQTARLVSELDDADEAVGLVTPAILERSAKSKAGAEATETREPWEMTPDEYVGDATGPDEVAVKKAAHPKHVKKALSEGKKVPREVLETYQGNGWAQTALDESYTEPEEAETATSKEPNRADKEAALIEADKNLELFRRNLQTEADEAGVKMTDLAVDKLDELRRLEGEYAQAKKDAEATRPAKEKREISDEEREFRHEEIESAFDQGILQQEDVRPGREKTFEEKKQNDLFGDEPISPETTAERLESKPDTWTDDMWTEYQAGNLTEEVANRLIAARPKMAEEASAQSAARQAAKSRDDTNTESARRYQKEQAEKRKKAAEAKRPKLSPAAKKKASALRAQLYEAETEEDIDALREAYESQKDIAGGGNYKAFNKDAPWENAKKRLKKTGSAKPSTKKKTEIERGVEANDRRAVIRDQFPKIYASKKEWPEIWENLAPPFGEGAIQRNRITDNRSFSAPDEIYQWALDNGYASDLGVGDASTFVIEMYSGKYVYQGKEAPGPTRAQEKEFDQAQEKEARKAQADEVEQIKSLGLGDRLKALENAIGKIDKIDTVTADYVIELALADERVDLRKARDKFVKTDVFKRASKKQLEKLEDLYDAAIEEVENIVSGPSESELFGFMDPMGALIHKIGKFAKETFGDRKAGTGKVHIPDSVKSEDSETVKEILDRKRAARLGAIERGLAKRVWDALKKAWHQFRSSFQYLKEGDPDTALIVDLLRQYRGAPSLARAVAYDATRGITEGLSPEEIVVFTDYLSHRDVAKDAEAGLYDGKKELRWGYSHKALGDNYIPERDIEKEVKLLEAIVNHPNNHRIKSAIEKRQRFIKKITKKLVNLDLLGAEALEDDRYYHHQVLEYLNAPADKKWIGAGGGADAHMRKKSFQMRRVGGSDSSLAYHEAEYEYISQAMSQITKAETLKRVKELSDIAPQLAEEAKQRNLDAYLLKYAEKESERTAKEDLFRKPVEDILKDIKDDPRASPLWGFTVEIAKNNAQLAKAAIDGKLPGVGFDDVLEDLADAYREHLWVKEELDDDAPFYFDHPDWFKWLAAMAKEKSIGFKEDPGPILAAKIFGAIKEREKLIKDALGKDFVTWRTLAEEREGYTVWQPKEGFHFFQAPTIPERVLEEVIGGGKILKEEDLRDVMARGTRLESWVIPENLAAELEEWALPEKGGIDAFARSIQTSWKQWTLLSPMRALRYNLNNMSGDLDITIAYDPKIALKYGYQAAKDLAKYHKGSASKALETEIQDGIKKGVIDSGLSIYEIPDISKTGAFAGIADPQKSPGKMQKFVDGYWRGVKGFTTWRENTLRLASYRYFQDKIAAGEKVYGASSKKAIDAMERNDDMAAKLARELIGDYGNVSRAGQFMRERLMPFYSWIEINAPRYVRMIRNASAEGRKGAGARKAVGTVARTGMKLGSLAARAHILYFLVAMYNRLRYPEEDRRINKNRGQFHVITGYDTNGVPTTVRFEGALADALEWFDLEDYPQDVRELWSGEKDFADFAAEAVKAPVNRVVQAWEPFSKTTFELALGKSVFPSVFQKGTSIASAGRPIRNRWEHLGRTFSMDWLVRTVSRLGDKPIPKRPPIELFDGDPIIGRFLQATLLYRQDLGEAAYWYTRHLSIEWKKKQSDKGDPGSFTPSERSNALYYYKTSVKWGDDKSAAAWYKEYLRLGGTTGGLNQSIDRAHPLDTVKGAKARRDFINSLSGQDRAEVEAAIEWYNKTYGKK